MEYSNILEKISEGIKKKEFAIFCGAGISFNSGLPLADELKRSILEKLPIDTKDIEEIMSSNLPFEAFMEAISGEDIVSSSMNIDISNILDIYKGGEPNTNHILIARLAKNGYLKTIFTTNFDLLIEKALKKEDKDFEVNYNEEQFSKIDFDNLNKVRIFKIHGSINDENSIRITMKGVANRILSNKRMKIINYMFSTGEHTTVLIFGYSCSDLFDVNPLIESIEENQKEIIFVEHSNEEYVEDIKIKDHNNPFKKFSGKRIKCNTDEFVKHLWNSFEENIGKYIPPSTKPTIEWKKHVASWDRILEENKSIKYYITASVFNAISSFNKSIKYYNTALGIIKDRKDKLEARCWGGLGYSYYMLGYSSKAIEYYDNALKIAGDIGDKDGESRVCLGLGYVYYDLEDYNKAIEYYNKALKARDRKDEITEARCYAGLGYAYYRLRSRDKAIRYYNKGLKIAGDIGDMSGESRCYAGLARAVYYSVGDYDGAITYYEKALKIAESIKDKVGVSRRCVDLGGVYCRLGNFNRAIEWYEKGLEVAKSIEDKGGELRCYGGLGDVYSMLGDSRKAVEYHEKSLKICLEIGDKSGEGKCYTNLGNAYDSLGDFRKAIEYHEKALKIYLEIGDKSGEGKCYGNLGNAYYGLGDFRKAIEYYEKDLKICLEIGDRSEEGI